MTQDGREEGPTPLEYGTLEPRRPRGGLQVLAGFLSWTVLFWSLIGLFLTVGSRMGDPLEVVATSAIFTLGALLVASMVFAKRIRWRVFVPGVLLGIALSCLVPFGVVAVVCGLHLH